MNEITSICYFAQENLDKGYDVQIIMLLIIVIWNI